MKIKNEEIIQIIKDKKKRTDIKLSSTLENELDIDSIDIVEIILECEKKFKIDTSLIIPESLVTVEDLIEFIKNRLNSFI